MTLEVILPVEIESSDVITLLRKLEIPRNKMINHDVDWWRITDGLHQYVIPSAPLVHGISYRTFKDKLLNREVELGGELVTVVDIETETLVNWLNAPELTESRGFELALTGRKLWVGNENVRDSYSYKHYLDFDSLEYGKAFQYAHTTEMGWLPVFRVNKSESSPLISSGPESIGAPTEQPGSQEVAAPNYTYVLECHNSDGSVVALSGNHRNITNCLNIMRLENTDVRKLQLTRKLIGPIVEYDPSLTLDDLL